MCFIYIAQTPPVTIKFLALNMAMYHEEHKKINPTKISQYTLKFTLRQNDNNLLLIVIKYWS